MHETLPCFALHDGRAGNVRQSEALAHWLGSAAPSLTLHTAVPWRWFAPRLLPGARSAFGNALAAVPMNEPCVVIGCGRQAALATRVLRSDTVRSVQILDPRIDARHWDIVVVPEHDPLRGDNVIVTQGSLNAIDDAWLQLHRTHAPEALRSAGPVCAIFIGGPTDDTSYSMEDVLAAIARVRESFDGLIYTCASPRTPSNWFAALRGLPADPRMRVWTSNAKSENPYAYLLAVATRIVCTPDSVNMLSESCATSVPVEYVPAPRMRGRVARFITTLTDAQRIRALGETTPLHATPLRESQRVAEEISRRLGLAARTGVATPA